MNFNVIRNNQRIPLASIPELPYESFSDTVISFLKAHEDAHCVSYFGYRTGEPVRLICCIARDNDHTLHIVSTQLDQGQEVPSLTAQLKAFHGFEREIHENLGIGFEGHPWLKPLRFSFDRADKEKTKEYYPFYSIQGEELHEVGVGPIHAGIIEPGYFRFICHGEKVLHLEIQLGYQHRGLERLMVEKKSLLHRLFLME